MEGQINVEIDEHGWEYAVTSFSNFSIGSKRRVSSALDCCRRRRWTRTRVPTSNPLRERFRPLNVFWDVRPLQNGAKKVRRFNLLYEVFICLF